MREEHESRLAKRMAAELEELREEMQLRTLDHPQGINLSSNDYLGLAGDARLKRATLEALRRAERVGSTGSRLLSGNSPEWEEAEKEFAEFAGTETALYFGSGYAANVGLLSSVLRAEDTVFSDALNHASLIDGVRLSKAKRVIYPHCDFKALEKSLRECGEDSGARLIVTESVFSMEGDVAPLKEYAQLARETGAELMVDEAHATGVWGPEGRGMVAQLGLERDVLAAVHTCGKALGSAGAFVCGAKTLKEFLLNRARTFIFSTAMPPYLAGQVRAAVKIARDSGERRAHLHEMTALLREQLADSGIEMGGSSTQIVPVILGSNEAALHVAEKLQAHGFAVKAIRPPTVPSGAARVRISLTSAMRKEDILRLAEAILSAHQSLRQISSASVVNA